MKKRKLKSYLRRIKAKYSRLSDDEFRALIDSQLADDLYHILVKLDKYKEDQDND